MYCTVQRSWPGPLLFVLDVINYITFIASNLVFVSIRLLYCWIKLDGEAVKCDTENLVHCYGIFYEELLCSWGEFGLPFNIIADIELVSYCTRSLLALLIWSK